MFAITEAILKILLLIALGPQPTYHYLHSNSLRFFASTKRLESENWNYHYHPFFPSQFYGTINNQRERKSVGGGAGGRKRGVKSRNQNINLHQYVQFLELCCSESGGSWVPGQLVLSETITKGTVQTLYTSYTYSRRQMF